MEAAALIVLGFSAAAVLGGWVVFRRVSLPRPPLGVLSLGDVVVMLVAVVIVPFLYLAIPVPVAAGLLLLATASALDALLSPLLRSPRLVWPLIAALLGGDVAGTALLGSTHPAFLALNDAILALCVTSIAALWAQSGLRARDAAVLAGAVALYDLVATALLPWTDDLLARLAAAPLVPMVGWGTGDEGGGMAIGLGDLLLAAVFPLVLRKAYGRAAGLVGLGVSLGSVVVLFLLAILGTLRGSFPVMVVLGPLLVIQHLAWRWRRGSERTTWQYLVEEPVSGAGPATEATPVVPGASTRVTAAGW